MRLSESQQRLQSTTPNSMATQLRLSILPGEIIAPGDTLNIVLPRPVDESTARSSIVLLGTGRETYVTRITIGSQGNTINVSTNSLSPGNYQLLINGLEDDGHEEDVRRRPTPFVIRRFQGQVPSNLRVLHATSVAYGDLDAQRLQADEETPEGFRRIEWIKAEDRTTSRPLQLAFDESGNSIDGEALLADIETRKRQHYGNMHPGLFSHVSKLNPADQVDIVVWPATTVDTSGYVKPTNGPIKESPGEERRLLEKARVEKLATVNRLKELGVVVRDPHEDYPFVYATLEVEHAQKLARLDNLGKLYLDDRSAKPDLADSLAISHASEAHSLGVRGAGVHVAVFEEGPDDHTKLDFTGQYHQTPPKSSHARLVSGIIKNTQNSGPKGYAPDCQLYSANSFDNAALIWALEEPQSCTVINQSFSRPDYETFGELSPDDLLKDYLVTLWPFPTIVQSAGNINRVPEFVNHRGYNSITVGNHNDTAKAMASGSTYLNPSFPSGDRELPEIAANGENVSAVGEGGSGTSFAAPAVAGTVALIQSVDETLKGWPEACRAILLASANPKISGSTWYNDVANHVDGNDGTGVLNARRAVEIARRHVQDTSVYEGPGWVAGTLNPEDFDPVTRWTFEPIRLEIPSVFLPSERVRLKIALAWTKKDLAYGPNLDLDLDFHVWLDNGTFIAGSNSHDNSYEIAEFRVWSAERFKVHIRNPRGVPSNHWYGLAWSVF